MKKLIQFIVMIVVLTLAIDISAEASYATDYTTYIASNGIDNCYIGVSASSTGLYASWRADADRMESVSLEVRGSYEFHNVLAIVESGVFRQDTNSRQTAEKNSVTIGSAKTVGYIRNLSNIIISQAIADAN